MKKVEFPSTFSLLGKTNKFALLSLNENVLLFLLTISLSISTKAQTFNNSVLITNWDTLSRPGFYQSTNISSVPHDYEGPWNWFWGLNLGEGTPPHQYTGQILLLNNPLKPALFFRSISSDVNNGKADWTKALNDYGNQTIREGDLFLGKTQSARGGYGSKLHFSGNMDYLDPFWVAKYNEEADRSDLRINIGDDYKYSNDRFVVGSTFHQDNQWYECFSVSSNGNVGIGVAYPDQKLEVAGTIRAREVKIENTNWPDYVFSKDYQLPSLSEVSKHIEENKHLPGIPSAKEVEENGINLSEMNAKLLQKIEEMTLYMIQQQEEINDLRRDMEDLKSQKE